MSIDHRDIIVTGALDDFGPSPGKRDFCWIGLYQFTLDERAFIIPNQSLPKIVGRIQRMACDQMFTEMLEESTMSLGLYALDIQTNYLIRYLLRYRPVRREYPGSQFFARENPRKPYLAIPDYPALVVYIWHAPPEFLESA